KLEKNPDNKLLSKLFQLDSDLSSIILEDKKSMHQNLIEECRSNPKFSKFIPESFTINIPTLLYYFQGRGLKRLLETLKLNKQNNIIEV
ncbi:hypothetical protein PIROE2DRAFT_12585, partial [Piromyces sp. E2]